MSNLSRRPKCKCGEQMALLSFIDFDYIDLKLDFMCLNEKCKRFSKDILTVEYGIDKMGWQIGEKTNVIYPSDSVLHE
jgi:hypothetical protein